MDKLDPMSAKASTKRGPGHLSNAIATIFINNSKWFPRFEVGIWKYIDIEGLSEDKITQGFGEDLFAEYRGYENREEIKLNYWIWVKDGEVFFWSFPEERLIPRYKPTTYYEPMDSVIVPRACMIDIYGKRERYTPFASDDLIEQAGVDSVIKDQFSSPARDLLSCF